MSIVKRQHYVWRHYLRAWASQDRIWAYLIEQKKTILSNLMGVAQQMYFYQLSELSAADGSFLRQFSERFFPSVVRPLVEDFVQLNEGYTQLKNKLQTGAKAANDANVEQQLRDVEVNSLERVHGKIEVMGQRLVACRSLADLQKLDSLDEDGLLTAVFFICVQHYRTYAQKNAAVNSFPPDWTDRVSRYWHILSFGLAAAMARGIMQNPNRQFCFIENPTPVEFVTGDQPVINLLDESKDEKGEATEMALYYPLAPTCALLIQFTLPTKGVNAVSRFQTIVADAALVAAYNFDIFKRCEQFVFSSNQTALNILINS